MKTIVICGASLIALSGILFFGFGMGSNKSELIFSKTFETKIKPDTLSSQINISIRRFSQDETVSRLTKFSDFIEKQKDLKIEGGTFSVNPNMIYHEGNETQDGYLGNIGYSISSKDPKKLNKFLREIQRLDIDSSVAVSIQSVTWQLSDIQKVGKSDELRLQAFKWADEYATDLSSKLGKKCEIKKVIISSSNGIEPMYLREREMESSMIVEENVTVEANEITAPTPTNEAQSLSISPSFAMECR